MRVRILNIVATLLFSFSQWFQIIIISNYLGNIEVGMYSLIIAITGPIVLLSRYSLTALVPTENLYKIPLIKYKNFRDLLNVGFIILVIIIAMLIDLSIYEKLSLVIYGIYKYFENKSDFIYIENITKKNLQFLASSKIIKSIIFISSFWIVILISNELVWALCSLVFVQVLIYNFYDKRFTSASPLDVKIDISDIKLILRLGASLTLVGVLISLTVNFPRYLIEYYYDKESLAIYATLLYLIVLANNIIITLNSTFIVDIVESFEKNIRSFKEKVLRIGLIYILLAIVGAVLTGLFGETIFSFVYGISYEEYEKEIILLAIYISLTIITKFLEMVLNVLNLYKRQMRIQLYSFIFTIILSFSLIPNFGLLGAFSVNIIVFILVILLQLKAIKSLYKRYQYE